MRGMKSAGEELRVETVDPGTLDLVKRLMADKRLDEFNLVGGTALALQLGHRKSIDVDLFSVKAFDTGRMAEYLVRQYNAEIFRQNDKAIYSYIGRVKVDIMRDPHPLIDKLENTAGVRMLSIRDIGAMKMYSVHDDGGRLKDFADIHKLLERNPLNTYLDYSRQKYPDVDPVMLKRLLVDQPKVDLDDRVQYFGKPVEWHEMADRFREAFRNPEKVFGEVNQLKNEHRIHKTQRQRRGHRPG
jgi:hypothetical protein